MSVVAVGLLLGVLVVFLIRVKQVKVGGAAVCIIFGLVLGATPAGPQVNRTLDQAGTSVWAWVQAL
jgi:regulator of protease activity HflC (stomatin/prohibitin superfamily)